MLGSLAPVVQWMVSKHLSARDVLNVAKTCKRCHDCFMPHAFRYSTHAASWTLSWAIREKSRGDGQVAERAKELIHTILRWNPHAPQLHHLTLAVEVKDLSMMETLLQCDNIQGEWKDLEDWGKWEMNPLNLAIRSGYDDGTDKLLRHLSKMKLNPDEIRSHGCMANDWVHSTPLHQACFKGNFRVAWELVNLGASVSSSPPERCWPLVEACSLGREDIVHLLLQNDALEGESAIPILTDAVSGNNIWIVQRVLDQKKPTIEVDEQGSMKDFNGARALFEKASDPATCGAIIEALRSKVPNMATASTSCRDGMKVPAWLLCALESNNTPLMKVILGWSAPQVSTDQLDRLLEIALKLSLQKPAEFLITMIPDSDKWKTYMLWHFITNPAAAEELLDQGHEGLHVNVQSVGGETILMRACRGNNKPLVQLLLRRGANVACKSESRLTCLQEAVEHADADVVDLLLDHGADEGDTPLFFAVRCGKIDNVRVLLERRGDQEFSSSMGEIIERALEGNSPDMVDLLLQSSKNASASAKQDMLYKATSDRFIDLRIVELLLESGADPNRKADDGPLTNACCHGRIDVVRTLFAHGAVIEASSDHQIMVALHEAVANGHMEVVRWLLEDRGVAVGDEDPVQGWFSLTSKAIPGRHFSMFRYIFERCESRLSHDQLDKILKLAFEQNKIEIAQYLLRETDVAKVTRSRSKPSDFGCKRSSMIKLFRQYQSTSTT